MALDASPNGHIATRPAKAQGPGISFAEARGMKSLPVPVARVRSAFADCIEDAKRGRRIRITRHGKPVGWIIGAEDRERLLRAKRGKSSPAGRSGGR
jgi:prevent-host-death family protein